MNHLLLTNIVHIIVYPDCHAFYLENYMHHYQLHNIPIHLNLDIFRINHQELDTWRNALPVSFDCRLAHPVQRYMINANPKAPNPPCPIQLQGVHRAGVKAKAAPGREQRHSEPGWHGRDRTMWLGERKAWPPADAPVQQKPSGSEEPPKKPEAQECPYSQA
jgi:hypothetical protein